MRLCPYQELHAHSEHHPLASGRRGDRHRSAAARSRHGDQRLRPRRIDRHIHHLARHRAELRRRIRGIPARRKASVDSAVGHQLRARRRRHLALAGAAHDAAHAGRVSVVVERDPQTSEGVRHLVSDHGSGDDRRLRLDRRHPLLCIFRTDAAADVSRDRRLGRRESRAITRMAASRVSR